MDNDIVEKVCRFRCLTHLADAVSVQTRDLMYLGSLRFVVRKRLSAVLDSDGLGEFDEFLAAASAIEPNKQEIGFAAEIEAVAIREGLAIDVGESLLLSTAIMRSIQRVVTGDKRAVCCCAQLSIHLYSISQIKGSIISFEQILARLICIVGHRSLRNWVCSDVNGDRTARICFGCHQETSQLEDILSALESYQSDLSRKSKEYTKESLAF